MVLMIATAAGLVALCATALATRKVTILMTTLAGAVAWNTLSPVCHPATAGWQMAHLAAVFLSAAMAAAVTTFATARAERRSHVAVLLMTALFISSFVVPAGVFPCSHSIENSALIARLHGWLPLALGPAIVAWFAEHLRGDPAGKTLRHALSLLGAQSLAFSGLCALWIAPPELLLLAPLLGAIGVLPIFVLWRFDFTPRAVLVRPLLSDLLLLVPLLASVAFQLRFVIVTRQLPPSVAALLPLSLAAASFVAYQLFQRLAILRHARRLLQLRERPHGAVSREWLPEAILRLGTRTLSAPQAWRLTEILKHAYDEPLRKRVLRDLEPPRPEQVQ